MATTTNFGWETPDDTDLVKDGALAMRTLGNAIDTSLVDLKGGTTGQVLSKTSNTDMDFTWVTSDDANAIQNAIVDAKGDLITATAADTPARLAVGSNGDTLVADSAATTGLRWQGNYAAGKNSILNADFGIWQRGTSIANSSAAANYTADRWFIYSGTASKTVSRQTTSDTTNLPFIQYCARVQRNSGNTALDSIIYAQSLETSASIPFVGRTVTLSFYARKGANFSSASDVLNMAVNTGTGTDQNNVTTYTGFATPLSQNVTLTSTWQRFSASATIATTATEIGIRFTYTPTGTAGASDYFEITGVQLEAGSIATAFQTATGTIQSELAACQRYYWILTDAAADRILGNATYFTSTEVYMPVRFPVTMRTNPTFIGSSGTNYYRMKSNSTNDDFNSFTQDQATINQSWLYNNTEVSGTGGYAGVATARTTSSSLAWSAEL